MPEPSVLARGSVRIEAAIYFCFGWPNNRCVASILSTSGILLVRLLIKSGPWVRRHRSHQNWLCLLCSAWSNECFCAPVTDSITRPLPDIAPSRSMDPEKIPFPATVGLLITSTLGLLSSFSFPYPSKDAPDGSSTSPHEVCERCTCYCMFSA